MKTIKKQLRRAFTIVELVIVIAVIAALAAILIPTFVNVVNSANESVDTSLVKNLNTILASEETLNGGKPSTMGQAMEWVEDNGYKVENLTPTSTGNILWDQTTNRFLLVDSDNNVVYTDGSSGLEEGETVTESYTYWYIINSQTEYDASTNYSLYINCDLSGETVTAKGGIEYAEGYAKNTVVSVTDSSASANEGKTSVSSVKKATAAGVTPTSTSVIIKTNGGTLTVSVTTAITALHYGSAESVKVSGGSYTAYADITGNIEISATNVTVEVAQGSTATTVLITASATTGIAISNTSSNTVSVGATSDILSGTSYEGCTTVTETISTDFAGGLGTEVSPYLISTAEQFANIATLSDEMLKLDGYEKYFKLIADIDLTTITFKNEYVAEYIRGGIDGAKDDGTSYKLYANDGLSYLFKQFGNVVISNIDYYLTGINTVYFLRSGSDDENASAWYCDYATFDNLDYYTTKTGQYYEIGHNDSLYFSYNIDYRSTYVKGSSDNAGERDGYCWGGVWTVENCDVYINLLGTAGQNHAVFFGAYIYDYSNGSSVTIDNCTYNGIFRGGYVALAVSNGQGDTSLLTINNLVNNGTLLGTNSARLVAAQNYASGSASSNAQSTNKLATAEAAAWYDAQGTDGEYGSKTTLTAEGLAVAADADGQIVITRETKKNANNYYEVEIYGSRRIYGTSYGAVSATDEASFSSDKTVNYNYSSNYNYALRFSVAVTDTNTINTGIYTGILVDYDTAIHSASATYPGLGLTIDEDTEWYTNEADSDCQYCMVTDSNGQLYYVLKFTSATNDYYYRMNASKVTLTVSAYEDNTVFGYAYKQITIS